MKKYEEISVSEMLKLDESEYLVIDIRDEIAFTYGTINNAVNIPQNQLDEKLGTLPKDKLLIITRIKKTIEYVGKQLDNFPKKEIELKKHIIDDLT